MAEVGDFVPSPKALVAAEALVEQLRSMGVPDPQWVRMPGGRIQLEWHRDGVDVEVDVEADGWATVWLGGVNVPWLVSAVLKTGQDDADALRPATDGGLCGKGGQRSAADRR